MKKGRKTEAALLGLILSLSLAAQADITVLADGMYFDNMRGGIASLMTSESGDVVALVVDLGEKLLFFFGCVEEVGQILKG